MKLMKSNKGLNERGFTIIELMIATTVLAVILLIVTVSMIGMGRLYFKGYNQSRIQANVRAITEDLSQNLKLNNQDPLTATNNLGPKTINAICIGGTRYNYILNVQINSSPSAAQLKHVLWRDSVSPTSCSALSSTVMNNDIPSPGGAEMIAPDSRLTDFSISPLTSPFTLKVGVAYGDTDLLDTSGPTPYCKGGIGDQFCSTSSLDSIVVRRVWE